MSTSENNCGGCDKILPQRIRVIKCDFCTNSSMLHVVELTITSTIL